MIKIRDLNGWKGYVCYFDVVSEIMGESFMVILFWFVILFEEKENINFDFM